MNMNFLLRMARMARHPPSPKRAALMVAVIVACFALWGVEMYWGWPDWLTVNKRR